MKAPPSRSGAQAIDWCEDGAEDLAAGDTKPAVEQRGIDLAEIGVMAQIAAIEIGEAGMFADDAGTDAAADEQNGRSRTVVGAAAAVFRGAPAEFGEGHDQNAIAMAAGGEIAVEGGHGIGKIAEEV